MSQGFAIGPVPEAFLIEVAKGNVPGHSVVHIRGFNSDIDLAATETLWEAGGIRVVPLVAGVATVVSTAAGDTVAGTGARTIKLHGLENTTFVDVTETLTLNGLVPVVGAVLFERINYGTVETAGATGSNEGMLTCTVGGLTQFGMSANENITQSAAYTIPAAKTGYLLSLTFGVSGAANATGHGRLMVRSFGGLWQLEDHFLSDVSGSGVERQYTLPLSFGEKTDIRIDASVDINNTLAVGSMVILLVDD